jgi:hypothetical protein
MKTYKMVDLHITQQQTKQIIVALQIERDRLAALKRTNHQQSLDHIIAYTRRQLKEAETPTEVDKLINKIAEW